MTYTEILDLINSNLASGQRIPATSHRQVEIALLDFIQQNLSQTGDIKMIKCDVTYLNDNFESNGLGKSLRLGWAICNGNNGTWDFTGRTAIGSGIGYSLLGAIGGEKEHTLTIPEIPSHTHGADADGGTTNSDGNRFRLETDFSKTIQTKATGGGLPHNNMQPYIVTLFIMKL